jgi:hypothetical protein
MESGGKLLKPVHPRNNTCKPMGVLVMLSVGIDLVVWAGLGVWCTDAPFLLGVQHVAPHL